MENQPSDQCGQRWIRALVFFGTMHPRHGRRCCPEHKMGLWHIESSQLDRVLAGTGLPDGAHALHLLTGEDAEEEADGYGPET
jgi:hypothetical protein